MSTPRYIVNVEDAVVCDGAYLLIERAAAEDHAAGWLAFPGGKLEAPPGTDDAVEATARRELAEEVGIEVGAVEYVGSRTFETDAGSPCLNRLTLCEHRGGEARPQEPEEVAAVHWLTPDEIERREATPAFLEADVARLERVRSAGR